MPAMYAWAHAHTHNHTLEKQPRLPMQRPPSMARTQEVKHSTPRHQLGFSFFAGGGAQGGVSLMPGPPPLTHTEPQLRKGAGPRAHSARGISGGGGPRCAASRSPGTIGPGGGARPPGLRSNSLFLPTFARAEPGREGEGSASWESKDGGKSRPCFASPSHLPKASRSEIVLHPISPLHLSLCMPELALAEFAICKLGRRRCCKPRKAAPLQAGGEFAMHA